MRILEAGMTSPETEKIYVDEHERHGAQVREIVGERFERNSVVYEPVSDIEYKTAAGKTVSFKEFLPEGWHIVRKPESLSKMFAANHELLAVEYPKLHPLKRSTRFIPEGEELPKDVRSDKFWREVRPAQRRVFEYDVAPKIIQAGFFISLLHEIGHAQSFSKKTSSDAEETIRFYLYRKNGIDLSDPVNKERYQGLVIGEERVAWAWALRKFRELERDGIDLEPAFKSAEEIKQFLHSHLDTYDLPIDPEAWDRIFANLDQRLKEEL